MKPPILTIGGQEVELAPVTFAALKKLAPLISNWITPGTLVEQGEKVVAILSVLLDEPEAAITERIIFREIGAMEPLWSSVMEWIGLVAPKSGEAPATS